MSSKKTTEQKKTEIEARAARLRHARKDIAEFSNFETFAKKHGISPRTYINHEQGTRGMKQDVAKNYAELLGVNFDWLYYGKGFPTQEVPSSEDMLLEAKRQAEKIIIEKNLTDSQDLKATLGACIMLKMGEQVKSSGSIEIDDNDMNKVVIDAISKVIKNIDNTPEKK